MSFPIPDNLKRLSHQCLISNMELASSHIDAIIDQAAERLSKATIQRIARECVEFKDVVGDYELRSKLLSLDVYVLSPNELHEMLAAARASGERDAIQYRSPLFS